MTANMAICAKVAESAHYLTVARATIARRHNAAAGGARQHAPGPWAGGDGPAAGERLRPLRRPP